MDDNQKHPPVQDYFIPGKQVTITAAINGFVCETDEGTFIATDPNQMLAITLGVTTNHAAMAKAKQLAEQEDAQ